MYRESVSLIPHTSLPRKGGRGNQKLRPKGKGVKGNDTIGGNPPNFPTCLLISSFTGMRNLELEKRKLFSHNFNQMCC